MLCCTVLYCSCLVLCCVVFCMLYVFFVALCLVGFFCFIVLVLCPIALFLSSVVFCLGEG